MPYILELQITDPSLKPLYEKSLSKLSSKEYCENPHKDSGFDIFTPMENVVIHSGETKLIDMKIQCAAYHIVHNRWDWVEKPMRSHFGLVIKWRNIRNRYLICFGKYLPWLVCSLLAL